MVYKKIANVKQERKKRAPIPFPFPLFSCSSEKNAGDCPIQSMQKRRKKKQNRKNNQKDLRKM
jgi:hypothetical protein